MRVAAQLHPQIVEADLLAEPFRPEEVGIAFVERDDVGVVDVGEDPFLLSPDAGPVRPLGGLVALLEELLPFAGVAAPQFLHVVLDFEQRAASLAAVDDRVDRVARPAFDALEPGLRRLPLLHRFHLWIDATARTLDPAIPASVRRAAPLPRCSVPARAASPEPVGVRGHRSADPTISSPPPPSPPPPPR